jgi:hypothetical protein
MRVKEAENMNEYTVNKRITHLKSEKCKADTLSLSQCAYMATVIEYS